MRKYIDLRITAISDEDLKDFLIALRKIQYCGDIGANRLLPIRIDGDGSGHIDVEIHKSKLNSPKLKNLRDLINLDEEKLKRVNDGDDFDTQYIGE
jgi:phage-related protein